MTEFSGKICLITGGTAGLGYAIAQRLANSGGTVIITGRDSARGARASAEIGHNAHFAKQNSVYRSDWDIVLAEISHRYGRLNILVNNVGLNFVKPMASTSYGDFLHLSRVNLQSTVLGLRHGGSLIAASGGGAILNISSIAARYANASVAPYCCAKAMVTALSAAAAQAMAPAGVRVNAVSPGIFLTELAERTVFVSDSLRDVQLARIPMGRFGNPSELAECAAFLLSDRSANITGIDIVMDGGRTAL